MVMKDVVGLLYNGKLHEWDRPLTEEIMQSEEYKQRDKYYKLLFATLNDEQKKLFEEYYLYSAGKSGLMQERAYSNGFKTGVLMAMQVLQHDPEQSD